MKTCSTCRVSKPVEAFDINRAKKDGRHNACRACDSARKKKMRKDNTDVFKAKDRARYIANKTEELEKRRKYYVNNRATVMARVTAYQRQNRPKYREFIRRWYAAHPEKAAYYTAKRRTAKMRAQPNWLSAIQLAQIQEFYDVAHARTVQTGEIHHVDHIEPLQGKTSRGLHVPWNLQVLTAADNWSKGNAMSPAPAASPSRG